MGFTTTKLTQAGFVADHTSVERSTGRQIDWANVSASYIDATSGKKVIPAGTRMGELLGSGKISPRVVTTNPAVGILETNAIEGDRAAALTGYGMMIGGVLYEGLLPGATGSPRRIPSAERTELDTAGCTFKWETYEDNRVAQ
jgi:hypothetical protein